MTLSEIEVDPDLIRLIPKKIPSSTLLCCSKMRSARIVNTLSPFRSYSTQIGKHGYREQCRLVHYLPETFIQGSNYFWMNENLFITELGQLIFSDSFSRLSLTLPTPAEFSVGQFSEFNVVVRKVVKYCRIHKLVDQDIVGPRIAPFTILNPYRSIMHIDWQSLCQRETLWAATPANDHHTKRDYTPQRSRALLIPPYYGALG
ncbi:MAG: hypothetical protein NXY57DRAFT_1061119 [Lentinula lateritia]|nr:MAG: hypothetical protein NXY57DRAFT_1061119 [Lentinula lateritia]